MAGGQGSSDADGAGHPPGQPVGRNALHQQTRPKFLLSGLIQCGCCGAGYVKVGQHRFGCAAARNKGAAICTNMLTIRRETFEAIVVDGLRTGLMAPELFKVFTEEFHAELDSQPHRPEGGPRGIRTGPAAGPTNGSGASSTCCSAVTMHARWLMDDIKVLEARKVELEIDLRKPTSDQPLFHPKLAEIYPESSLDLNSPLEHPDTQAEAFELIRSLIEVDPPGAGEWRATR